MYMHVCVYVYVRVCVTCVPRTCAESLTGMDTQAVWRGYSTRAVVPALLMHAHRVCGIMRRQRARLLRQVSSLYPVLSGFSFSGCISLSAVLRLAVTSHSTLSPAIQGVLVSHSSPPPCQNPTRHTTTTQRHNSYTYAGASGRGQVPPNTAEGTQFFCTSALITRLTIS